jgi:DNA-binding NarL/FixJ family response regulator
MTSDRKMIPDFEVSLFFNAIAPGKKQKEIAKILGVDPKTVSRWIQNGMPTSKARELVAWRVSEILRESATVSRLMDEYGL